MMHLIVRRQACRSRSENLAIAQRCSSGTRTPRLTPRGADNRSRYQVRVDSPAIDSVGASPGRDATCSDDDTTPPGVAALSESPRLSFSPEPIARPAFRHRNVSGIGSRNCPRKGPCTAWHSTWALPRGTTQAGDSSWGTVTPASGPSYRRPFFPFGVFPIPLRLRLEARAQTLRRRALDPQPRACRRSRR
jgi:hypothetical protein